MENTNETKPQNTKKLVLYGLIALAIILILLTGNDELWKKAAGIPMMAFLAMIFAFGAGFIFTSNFMQRFKICFVVFLYIGLITQYATDHEVKTPNSYGNNKCMQCGNNYSGYGWSTVGGEQFQPTDHDGGYCSKQCAYNSQPAKWKH